MKKTTNRNWIFEKQDWKLQMLKDNHITIHNQVKKQKPGKVILDEDRKLRSDQKKKELGQ